MNKSPPGITISRKDKGGIAISTINPSYIADLDEDTIKGICHEYRLNNASVSFKAPSTADDLIDAIEGNRVYMPALYVMNKIDQITIEELDIINDVPHYVPVSAHHEWNLDGLIEAIWTYLGLVRVYTKPRGEIPDYSDPVVLRENCCKMEDFCNRIHRDLLSELKYSMVWGRSVKHYPQKVGKDHQLCDEDVVQIVKK
eukprot:GHVR01055110.1.p1 GENE.GHVR01055110.1~~GHVR01055110.1.p1  ORF type:complete len:199 (+),score=31.19 GHVR01055110.1:331-927(+)